MTVPNPQEYERARIQSEGQLQQDLKRAEGLHDGNYDLHARRAHQDFWRRNIASAEACGMNNEPARTALAKSLRGQ